MPQNHLPKCLKPKKQTLSLKQQFRFKKAYKFLWKKATEPSSKMPEAKKNSTLIEKTQFCKFIWKKAGEPSSKMPEAKKQTLSLKKQFCFKKSL